MQQLKKIAKYLLAGFLTLLLVLGILSFSLLKSSTFQTYVTQKIGDYFSGKTNTTITVKSIDIEWFKTLVLNDVLIIDEHQDTLLYSGKLKLGINAYNFEKRNFSIGSLGLSNSYLNIQKYSGEDSTNISKFIARLGIKKNKSDSTNFEIQLKELSINGLKFRYWNHNKDNKLYGVDYHHLLCKSVDGNFENLSFKNDSVNAYVENLSLSERSGFKLKNLQGQVLVCPTELTINDMVLETRKTKLKGKLSFSYEQYSDFKDFIHKVKIQSTFTQSKLNGKDLSYFVPVLKGIEDSIIFSGTVSGKVDRLKLKKLRVSYGELSYFKGELSLDGLPDWQNTFIYIDIDELVTFDKDVAQIPLPPFTTHRKVTTPPWLSNLEIVSFSGNYTGFPGDFVAYGRFKTACGVLFSDIKLKKEENKDILLSGSLKTQQFNLSSLLNNNKLGKVTFIGDVNSLIQGGKFKVNMKGEMPRFDFASYSYSGIKVDGELSNQQFLGSLSVRDTNIHLNFEGGIDFSNKIPQYDFKAEVKDAKLHNLGLVKRDSSTSVSFNMEIALEGSNLDDIQGKLTVNDFDWAEKGKNYHFNDAIIESIKLPNKEMLSINSDWLVAKIEGNYHLKDLRPSVLNILSRDLPSLVDWKYSQSAYNGKNDFRLMFKVKNYDLIHELFTPKIDFKNAQFSGLFNDKIQEFQFNFYADTLVVDNRAIENVKIHGNNKQNQVQLTASSSKVQVKDTLGLKSFKLDAVSSNNVIDYQIAWDNQSVKKNYGNIKGKMGIAKLDSVWTQVQNLDLSVEDKLWTIHPDNGIVFSPGKVNFHNFSAGSKDQEILIDGVMTQKESSDLKIKAENFELENFSAFFQRYKTDVKGEVNGDISIQGDITNPILKGDFTVDSFMLNKQTFGKVYASSNYLYSEGRMAIDLRVENLSSINKGNCLVLKGDYFPSKNGALNMDAQFTNFRVQFLEKYFEGVFSDFNRGKASGKISAKGTLKDPELYGKLRLDQMNLKVDYLNVEYAINGQYLYFNDDLIEFKNFELGHNIYDKSSAMVNGNVKHKAFTNFSYTLDSIRLKDVLCLNTSIDDNSSYYGTAFANGLLKITGKGKESKISGSIISTTYEDKNKKTFTKLTMPLHEVQELQASDFINFVNLKERENLKNKQNDQLDLRGLELDLNFIVDDQASVKIIFDPRVGDEVEAYGNGNINMKINSEGKFQMTGNYEITQGKYYFTLKKFIGKKFLVEKGSSVVWDGDPLNANININTYYEARAKLIDLANPTAPNYQDLVEQFSSRIPVNANINMSGRLLQPDVTMSVSLPSGLPQEQDFLSTSLIGEDEINRQVFSLLLTNQFLPTNNSLLQTVSVGTGIDNGLQFLEGQLNNALGGVLNNFDLGVDYNSSRADTLSSDQLRLLMGFKYKKVSLRTDYDINNNAGEILAEYKITDRLKAKAYRRTTEQVITDNGNNVTQGIGVLYQKSFDRFKDLFTRSKREKVTGG